MTVLGVKKENCTGCRLCRQVCGIEHFDEINPRKAVLLIEAKFPDPGGYRPRVCTQCGNCAKACPEDAIYLENGIYLVDKDKCTSCFECIEACPFGVMMKHKEETFPFKCDFCFKCTEVCNTGALYKKEKANKK